MKRCSYFAGFFFAFSFLIISTATARVAGLDAEAVNHWTENGLKTTAYCNGMTYVMIPSVAPGYSGAPMRSYIRFQGKGVPVVNNYKLTKADILNGIEWEGVVYAEGKGPFQRASEVEDYGPWVDTLNTGVQRESEVVAFAVDRLQKKDGTWRIAPHPERGAPLTCEEATNPTKKREKVNQTQAPVAAGQADSILKLEQEVAANPSSGPAWTRLGNVYYDTDQFAKSINAYNKALEINPNLPEVWSDLGVMYRRNKQPREAIRAFDHALSLNPSNEPARFNKGVTLIYDLKEKAAGLKVWEEMVAKNPNAKAPNGQLMRNVINASQ